MSRRNSLTTHAVGRLGSFSQIWGKIMTLGKFWRNEIFWGKNNKRDVWYTYRKVLPHSAKHRGRRCFTPIFCEVVVGPAISCRSVALLRTESIFPSHLNNTNSRRPALLLHSHESTRSASTNCSRLLEILYVSILLRKQNLQLAVTK